MGMVVVMFVVVMVIMCVLMNYIASSRNRSG